MQWKDAPRMTRTAAHSQPHTRGPDRNRSKSTTSKNNMSEHVQPYFFSRPCCCHGTVRYYATDLIGLTRFLPAAGRPWMSRSSDSSPFSLRCSIASSYLTTHGGGSLLLMIMLMVVKRGYWDCGGVGGGGARVQEG